LCPGNDCLREVAGRTGAIRKALLGWASAHLRRFPWREGRTPYRIMVAEFLLKRTTSAAVTRVYDGFVAKYPGVRELAQADISELEDFLETIGYHRLRARALKETARHILENFGGQIPSTLEELRSIPNIGSYTAGAILSLGYDKRAPMVDSNVERVLKRLFSNCLQGKISMGKLDKVARVLVPDEDHDLFNLALIDLGALVCRYRKPLCDECPLYRTCDTHSAKVGDSSSVPKDGS